MRNIALLMTIWLSVIIGQVYAKASNFKFIFHNTSVDEIQVTKVCKHNTLDPCDSVITFNPGETKEVFANQDHHTKGMEVDWQIVKKRKDSKQILCGISVHWHLRYNKMIGHWAFFGRAEPLSKQYKKCDRREITGSGVSAVMIGGEAKKSSNYTCGEIDGHRCYKITLNIS